MLAIIGAASLFGARGGELAAEARPAGIRAHASYRIVKKAEISAQKPAFQSLGPNGDLIVSSFGLRGADALYRIVNPGEILHGQAPRLELVTEAVIWPNEAKWHEAGEFGAPGLLIASGFLFPPKSTGALWFLDVAGRLSQLTKPKLGWFYHRAAAVDWSGTGRRDLLTARARIPPVGPADGELVWLKRPARPLDEPWEESVLAKGPDIHFRLARNEADGAWIVAAAEFSAKRIALYWQGERGRIERRIVDNTLGPAFDLDFQDLDGDGRPELLATNHENEARKSRVFAYVVPRDMKAGAWARKTLLANVETRQPGVGQASPGAAKAFFPEPAAAAPGDRPWIVVSGDGSQRAHLLRPRPEDADAWAYDESEILDAKSTVGEPLAADFDGDGLTDLAIPAYDNNKIYLFSVEPGDEGAG